MCWLLQAGSTPPSISLEELVRHFSDAFGVVQSLRVEERWDSAGFTRVTDIVLSGRPAWKRWRYEYSLFPRNALPSGRIGTFDGQYYWMLEDDGLGLCVTQYSSPDAYIGVAGISLAHSGLGPEGDQGSFALALDRRTFSLAGDPSDPARILLLGSGWSRTLHSRIGFMPVEYRQGSIQIQFSNHRQVGPLWLPQRIERLDPGEPYTITLRDWAVNEGVSDTDFAIAMPYGTSILYDQDATRIYGTGDRLEAETGLNNWLLYYDWGGRASAPNVEPQRETVLRRDGGWRALFALAAFVATALLWLAPLLWRRPGAARQVGAAAILLVSAGSMTRAAAQDISSGASAANAAYLALCTFHREAHLDPLYSALESRSGGECLAAIADVLSASGLAARVTSATPDDLDRWRYPCVLEFRPRSAHFPNPYFVVYVGRNEFGRTLLNPNPFGALRPVSEEFLGEHWTGRAILVAPEPIQVHDPWGVLAIIAGVVLGISLVLKARPMYRGFRSLVGLACLVLSLPWFAGCSGSDQGAAVSLTPLEWNIGDSYGGQFTKHFAAQNGGSRDATLVKVESSCGASENPRFPRAF